MPSTSVIHEENREFIRHPTDIPIEYYFIDTPVCYSDSIESISLSGLSFSTVDYIEPNKWLKLHIPIKEDFFELSAKVRWCKPSKDKQYLVGVTFISSNDAYAARMVEQVCQIEHYKKQIQQNEGRILTCDEAAAEWIEKYAESFPKVF